MALHEPASVRARVALAILAAAAVLVLASVAPALAAAPVATPSPAGLTVRSGPPSPSLAAARAPNAAASKILFYFPPEWINVTQPGANATPPAGYDGTMAFDPADHETIYFGGCSAAACPQNETWGFAGGHWTNLTDVRHAPPARVGASMDYDANMGGVLLFGGYGASGYLADTWLFRHGVWTNLTWVGPGPAARELATMTFDPEPEENGSVLFGGYVPGVGYATDTWVWEGWSGWVPLAPNIAPPATLYSVMAYSPAARAVVLYRPDLVNQTWELYAGQWWQVNPTAEPTYREDASTVYDPALQEVLLFGGTTFSGDANDTWAFTGGTWLSLSTTSAPPVRQGAAIGLDPSGSAPVLFGGVGPAAYLNDTWVFEVPPGASLTASPSRPEVSAPVTFTAAVGHGTAPYTATFSFGDGTRAAVTSSSSPLTVVHAYDAPGSFTPSVAVTDGVGATAAAAMPAITVAAGPSVAARAGPSSVDVGSPVAFSAAGSSGVPPLNYTWAFGDGTTAEGANVSHAYAAAGVYVAQVTATDSQGGTANATVTVRVAALPTASILVVTPSPAEGSPVALLAPLSGGTAPFRYAWSFGDGSASAFAAPLHTYNRTGTYTVQVWVNDSSGGGTHATLQVTVASVAASGGGAPLWFWAALAALVAVGAVGVALLVVLPRRGRPPKSPPAT